MQSYDAYLEARCEYKELQNSIYDKEALIKGIYSGWSEFAKWRRQKEVVQVCVYSLGYKRVDVVDEETGEVTELLRWNYHSPINKERFKIDRMSPAGNEDYNRSMAKVDGLRHDIREMKQEQQLLSQWGLKMHKEVCHDVLEEMFSYY